MKAGTSETSTVKRRGRPPKAKVIEEAPVVAAPVAKSFDKEEKPSYRPAADLYEFEHQISLAQVHGVKSIEVTSAVMSQLLKAAYPPASGYMIYKNVWVFEEGKRAESLAKDARTMETILFGQSKVGIGPEGMKG